MPVCSAAEAVGDLRYVFRAPDDGVEIGLYVLSTVLFAVGAVGFYLRWLSVKGNTE